MSAPEVASDPDRGVGGRCRRDDRPAAAARRGGLPALPRPPRGGRGDPRDGDPRRPGDRRGRRVRPRARRAQQRRGGRAAARAVGGGLRRARRHAADRRQPVLGDRAGCAPASTCTPPRAERRCETTLLAEAQRIEVEDLESCRAHGRPRRRAAARRGAGADPLQRGCPRHGRLRHGARRRPLGRAHRQARRRVRGRDAAVPAGRPADRLGAAARRDPGHAADRRHGRLPDGARRDQRGGRGRGPDRRERRRREQDRHLHRRGAGA